MPSREREIEDAVIAHPEVLGFPGATAIRNVRVGIGFGRIDVMLFPRTGDTKLVLVEAKTGNAPDSISKVMGQLLMYYAGALRIGADGFDCYRSYSESNREKALGVNWTSPKEITGGVSPPSKAWSLIGSGEKLRPMDIRLFIAIDSEPHDALRTAVQVLGAHHDLQIGLITVEGGRPRILRS